MSSHNISKVIDVTIKESGVLRKENAQLEYELMEAVDELKVTLKREGVKDTRIKVLQANLSKSCKAITGDKPKECPKHIAKKPKPKKSVTKNKPIAKKVVPTPTQLLFPIIKKEIAVQKK